MCLAATVVDGLVLARSAFHHSMNYRSVIAHGTATVVTRQPELSRALDAVLDHVRPGRSGACRAPSAKELAATTVLALDLDEVSAKCRSGDPVDEPADLDAPYWAGVVPVRSVLGDPEPSADLNSARSAS